MSDPVVTRHAFNFARSVMTAAVVLALLACASIVAAAVFLIVTHTALPDALREWVALVLGALLSNLALVRTLFEKSAEGSTP